MIQGVRPSCASCHWFARFSPEEVNEEYAPVTQGGEASEGGEHLLEYGKCIRNPPQFFYETLNGEWPVIHESKVCGEYRVTNPNPYI